MMVQLHLMLSINVSLIKKKLPLDGSSAMNGNLDMGQHSITNLKDPKHTKPHMLLM